MFANFVAVQYKWIDVATQQGNEIFSGSGKCTLWNRQTELCFPSIRSLLQSMVTVIAEQDLDQQNHFWTHHSIAP
jgi:hypothetical protein